MFQIIKYINHPNFLAPISSSKQTQAEKEIILRSLLDYIRVY